MPTARFEADFSAFLTAIDAATLKMADMSKGANDVEKNLNAMVDTFSGRQLIQEASELTIAIDKIGGVSALTANELETVGNKANEAVEKMRALGYEIPAGLQNLADATRANVSASNDWSSSLSTMAGVLGAIGIQTTAEGMLHFAENTIAAGAAIEKAAAQTGMTATEVQKLQHVADETGTSFHSMVTAAQTLEQHIGSGDKNLTAALDKLGISLETLKGLDAYTQLTTMADAVAAIQDPTDRAATAAEVFGKNWKELLPAILGGIKDIGDQATTMSDDTVTALKKMEDSFKDLKTQATVAMGDLLLHFNNLATVLDKNAEAQDKFSRSQYTYANAVTILRDAVRESIDPIQVMAERNDALQVAMLTIPDAAKKVANGLQAVTLSAQEENDAWGQLGGGPLKDIAKYDADLAKAYGELSLAGDGWRGTLDNIDGAVVESIKYYRDAGVSVSALKTIYSDLGDTAFAAIDKMRKAEEQQSKSDTKFYDELVKKDNAAYDQLQKKHQEYYDFERKQFEDKTTYEIDKLYAEAEEEKRKYTEKYGYSKEYNESVDSLTAERVRVASESYDKEAQAAEDAYLLMAQKAAGMTDQMIKAYSDQLNGVLGAFIEVGHAADDLKAKFAADFSSGPAGPVGGLPTNPEAGSLSTDPRITGLLSQGYTLGEAFAIVSGYGGSITLPAGRASGIGGQYFGGAGGVTVNVNGSVLGDPQAIAKAVGDAFQTVSRQQGYTLPAR